MKTLHSCNVARLQQMEFITLLRETTADVETAAGNLTTTDVPLKRYLKETKDGTDHFEVVTRNPAKDPKTAEMKQKDNERDKAVSRFMLKFQIARLSDNAAEQTAYGNLQILWERHSGIQKLNFSNQTGATDNLLNDLKKEPFASAVTTLHLETEVTGIRTTNDAFRTFMASRRASEAEAEETHIIKMRRELTDKYTSLCIYVMAMTDAYPAVPEWGKALTAINVIRKRYTELLNRRAAALKDDKDKKPKDPKQPKAPKNPKDPKLPKDPKDPKKPGGGDDIHTPEEPPKKPGDTEQPTPKPGGGTGSGDDIHVPSEPPKKPDGQ